jgi:hypothetical protein
MTEQPSPRLRLTSNTYSENELEHLRPQPITLCCPSPSALVAETFFPSPASPFDSDDFVVDTQPLHELQPVSEYSFPTSSIRHCRSATPPHVPFVAEFELSSLASASAPSTRQGSPCCETDDYPLVKSSRDRRRPSQLPWNPRGKVAPSFPPMPSTPTLHTVALPTVGSMRSTTCQSRQGRGR